MNETTNRQARCTALALAVATSLGLAACTSGSSTSGSASGSSTGGAAVQGSTAYFAEQPLETPTYIFPLVSGENFSGANTADLHTLLYQPLYWYGDKGTQPSTTRSRSATRPSTAMATAWSLSGSSTTCGPTARP